MEGFTPTDALRALWGAWTRLALTVYELVPLAAVVGLIAALVASMASSPMGRLFAWRSHLTRLRRWWRRE